MATILEGFADFLTMHEASRKPCNAIAYAFLGDLRFNMARSHIVMAAPVGSDLRLGGPAELAPPADVVEAARGIERIRARSTRIPRRGRDLNPRGSLHPLLA
jgi:ornithine carbamoyltransferase